ncbi:MAG: MmcQ/YjbR family DNA-binding protein [Anaerolineae bacterium]|nr:MmcQ/YjbR family DNA-binding protein [Anaerolineae bacterium]
MEAKYQADVKAMMDEMVLGMPGVKGGKAFGYPAYKVAGKVFAFVGGKGISLKLPEARVQELIAGAGDIKPFEVADGIVWKAWVSIEHADAAAYEQDVALIEESVGFVAGG